MEGHIPPTHPEGNTMQRNLVARSLATLFDFRVLVRYDQKFAVHVAHCIETGTVATANSPEDASAMMRELLEDEVMFALRHRNLKNLFSSPAPLEVHLEWIKAAQREEPKIEFLDVDVKQLETNQIDTKNAHLQNRVQFALAA